MTTTDLTNATSLQLMTVAEKIEYAKILAAATLLPDAYRQHPENIFAAVEYGRALGLEAMEALQRINVIKGRPSLSSDTMAMLVRRAGHKLRIQQHDDGSVTASIIRADDPDFEFKVTWNEERARRAGLWGQRGPWTQYPEQMLRNRAVSEVCRQAASDALAGLIYTPEEVESIGTTHAPQPTQQPAPQPGVLEGEQRQRVLSEIKGMLAKADCDTSTAPVIYEMAVEAGAAGSPDALRAWMRQAWREHALPLVHLGEVEAEDQAEQPTLDGEVVEAGETA